MEVKIYKKNLSDLNIDPKLGLKDYSILYPEGIKIKEFLKNKNFATDIKSGRTPSKFNQDYWNGEYEFLTMQDIDTSTFILNKECTDKITDFAIDREKTLFQAPKNSLLISNAMTIGLSVITDRDVYINQNVFCLNTDESKTNKKFLKWYFNTVLKPAFQKIFFSKYISKEELARIKVPFLTKQDQDQIVAKIEPIENEINKLNAQIKEPLEIINAVFAKEFNFDNKLWREFGKGMTAGTQKSEDKKFSVFEIPFSALDKSSILRFSTRFHNPPTQKLMEILNNTKNVQVKNIVLELRKGVQPQYDTSGDIRVVKINNMRNNHLDFSEAEFVSEDFYLTVKHGASVKKGDILICCTGKISLGKIDYYTDEEKAILSVDSYVIRIDKNKILPLFFVYFIRSILGAFQIERDYTGTTNQIHLYDKQISNFQIPNISLTNQQTIVDEIKAELDKQEQIRRQTKAERAKIDTIIEKAIKQPI